MIMISFNYLGGVKKEVKRKILLVLSLYQNMQLQMRQVTYKRDE